MIGFLISVAVLLLIIAIIVIPILWLCRCKHRYHLVRTIHGDEINYRNGKRRIYSCDKCGKVRYE